MKIQNTDILSSQFYDKYYSIDVIVLTEREFIFMSLKYQWGLGLKLPILENRNWNFENENRNMLQRFKSALVKSVNNSIKNENYYIM